MEIKAVNPQDYLVFFNLFPRPVLPNLLYIRDTIQYIKTTQSYKTYL